MNQNKKLLSLFGTYSAILLLTAMIGVIALANGRIDDSSHSHETVVQTEYVYVWADVPDASTSVQDTSKERVWIVREYEEMICIFAEDGALVSNLDVYVKTLPEADRKMLREGIHVTSEEQLRALIEDYSS